jgi:SAM-dependent methyltransferase
VFAWFAITAHQEDTSPLPHPAVNAPFVRTPEDVVDKMLELAEPKPDDLVYDLGCGDGRIVVRAAEKYGCRAVGFDIDPERVEEARENAREHGVEERVTIVEQDVLTLDLAEADLVTLYLLPRLNEKLLPQLKRLKPGARIVSHDFGLPGIEPAKTVEFTNPDGERTKVLYLWIAPVGVVE